MASSRRRELHRSVVPYAEQDVYRGDGPDRDMPSPGDQVRAGQVVVRSTPRVGLAADRAVMAHLAAQDAAGAARQEARSNLGRPSTRRGPSRRGRAADQADDRRAGVRPRWSRAATRKSPRPRPGCAGDAQVEAAKAAQRPSAAMSEKAAHVGGPRRNRARPDDDHRGDRRAGGGAERGGRGGAHGRGGSGAERPGRGQRRGDAGRIAQGRGRRYGDAGRPGLRRGAARAHDRAAA